MKRHPAVPPSAVVTAAKQLDEIMKRRMSKGFSIESPASSSPSKSRLQTSEQKKMTLHRDLLALQVRVDQFKIEEEKEKPFVKQGEGIPDPFGDDNHPSSGALPCNNKLKFIGQCKQAKMKGIKSMCSFNQKMADGQKKSLEIHLNNGLPYAAGEMSATAQNNEGSCSSDSSVDEFSDDEDNVIDLTNPSKKLTGETLEDIKTSNLKQPKRIPQPDEVIDIDLVGSLESLDDESDNGFFEQIKKLSSKKKQLPSPEGLESMPTLAKIS